MRKVERREEMLLYAPKISKEALLLGIKKFKELYGKEPGKLLISKDFKDVVPEQLEVLIEEELSSGYFRILP